MSTNPKFPNPAFINDLVGKLGDILKQSPAKDIEQNLKAGVTAMLGKLDLVTREEFDVQSGVLARTRARLKALEEKVAALEAQLLTQRTVAHGILPPATLVRPCTSGNREIAMTTLATPPSVKVIGANGQISLGKQFAGRQVLVEEQEPGVWLVRTATVIPDNERWLHEPQAAVDLARALDWATANTPRDTDVDAVIGKLANGQG